MLLKHSHGVIILRHLHITHHYLGLIFWTHHSESLIGWVLSVSHGAQGDQILVFVEVWANCSFCDVGELTELDLLLVATCHWTLTIDIGAIYREIIWFVLVKDLHIIHINIQVWVLLLYEMCLLVNLLNPKRVSHLRIFTTNMVNNFYGVAAICLE